ncbi:MAG: hypothetical protein ACK47B_19410 [Armatimonadota bacterium]
MSQPSPEPTAPSSPLIPPLVWVLAALAVLVRVGVAWGTHFTNEDALITLRYAENLAHGLGFVYNPGERVLGTTTPLYTLLLAVASWLGAPALYVGKALNIAADGALCLVAYRWLTALGWERAGRAAAFWIAVHPLHIRWAVSGMETSLVALCGAAAWLAYTHRRELPAYALLAALFLLRWDGALLAGAVTVAFTIRERRIPWRGLALFLVLAAPWLAFATLYFGSPLPGTAAAKMTVYNWPGALELFPGTRGVLTRLVEPAYLAAHLVALIGLRQVVAARSWALLPPLAWALLYLGAIAAAVRVPVFEWYLVPPLPVHDLLVGIGIVTAAEPLCRRQPPAAGRLLAGTAAAVLAVGLVGWSYHAARTTQLIEDRLRKPMALWLREQVAPGETIMLEPIGYAGYFSGRRILDVIGLVSPEVIPYWRRGGPSPLWEIARTRQPEWIVLRPRELENVTSAAGPEWEQQYARVRTFRYRRPRDRQPFVFYVYRRIP